MAMPDPIKFKVSDKGLEAAIWSLIGAGGIVQELLAIKAPVSETPGFQLALALAQKNEAEHRARVSSESMRAAAKAGHDIRTAKAIYSSVQHNDVYLEIHQEDLVDMAQG